MSLAPIRAGLQVSRFNFAEPAQLLDRLTEIATTAEASGFDSLYVMDHVHQIPGNGPEQDPMLEGTTTLGALAARTSTIGLGLLVGGVTYRNAALMAKISTTLDVLSGGRAIHGIGAAWFEAEHVAYGFDFPPLGVRFERLEEALKVTRAMFTQDRPKVAGAHHWVERPYNNPRPLRGDIPILIGGSGERKTLRLVAQYADACNVFGDVERVRHLMGVLDRHCEDVGRDPADISKTKLAVLCIAETHEAAQAKLAPIRDALPAEQLASFAMAGDPDGVGEQIAAYRDAGLDGLIVVLPDVHDVETVALAGEVVAAATRD
jgi:F420-dependent oxidoreductase-like protein